MFRSIVSQEAWNFWNNNSSGPNFVASERLPGVFYMKLIRVVTAGAPEKGSL
jgi:hypothetical protein